MATLYRPRTVEYRFKDGSYRTQDGKRVTKNTPGAVRRVIISKFWYARYKDGNGEPVQKKLSESKETARRMLAKLTGDAQLASVGLIDPFENHRGRSLGEHLEDFRKFLVARGNCSEYVRKTHSEVKTILDACQFERTEDMQATAVMEFLADQRRPRPIPQLDREKEWYSTAEVAAVLGTTRKAINTLLSTSPLTGPAPDRRGYGRPCFVHREMVQGMLDRRNQGMSPSTSNDYLRAVKQFSKWLVKERRAPYDPLAYLQRQNTKVDKRHPRRALREDLFGKFVEATVEGRDFRGLPGTDRLIIYTLAANTGFRAKELGSLIPASFDFDATPPTVTVEAAFSKHRRKDVQPLRADVAEMMRQYVEGRPPRALLWPGDWKKGGAQMVRIDLATAGIPYEDDAGRLFDFHAMRGQFISQLAAQGVHPKVAQQLARHSSIVLTMDFYTHLDVFDVTGALDKLPALPAGSGSVKATEGQEEPADRCKARARRKQSG